MELVLLFQFVTIVQSHRCNTVCYCIWNSSNGSWDFLLYEEQKTEFLPCPVQILRRDYSMSLCVCLALKTEKNFQEQYKWVGQRNAKYYRSTCTWVWLLLKLQNKFSTTMLLIVKKILSCEYWICLYNLLNTGLDKRDSI